MNTRCDHPSGVVLSHASVPRSVKGFTGVDLLSLAIFVIFGLLHVLFYNRIERLGSDSSVYIVLAENLRTGAGYQFNGTPHTIYPPGFPILLAGIGTLFGNTSYELLVRWMPIFSSVGLVCWYFVLRLAAERKAAAVACLLAATTVTWFVMNTGGVLSESAYIASTGAAALSLTLLISRRRHALLDAILVAGTIFFTIASVMIRSAGIALGVGMGIWAFSWLLSRRSCFLPQIAALTGAALSFAVLLLWVGWTIQVQHAKQDINPIETYASQFSTKDPHRPELGKATLVDLVFRGASNLSVQTSHIAHLFTRLPYVAAVWYSPLIVFTLILLCVGSVGFLREAAFAVPTWYFANYLGVYLLWPFDEGPRFMLPVAPIAFVLLWKGICMARTRLQTMSPSKALGLGIVSAMIGLGSFASWPPPGLQGKASMIFWFLLAGFLVVYSLSGYRFEFGQRSARLGWALVLFLLAVGILQQYAAARANLNPNPTGYGHYASGHFGVWLRDRPSGRAMAQQASIIHRVSGRQVTHFPVTSDVKILVDSLRRYEIRYLMVSDPGPYPYFLPTETERYERIATSHPGMLQLVYRGPGYRVFEVFSGPAP